MPVVFTRMLSAAALAALVAAAPLALSTTAAAQGTEPGAQQSAPPMQLNDEKLRSFAAATLEVESLNEEWSPRIASATEADDQENLRGQAMEQMAAAVREQGLSVEEYNAMVQAVQADPQVASTVEAYREELR